MIRINTNKSLLLLAFLTFSLIIINKTSADDSKLFIDKGNFLLSGMINVSNYSYSQEIWEDTEKVNILMIDGTSSLLGFISKGFGIGVDFNIQHRDEKEFELSLTQIGVGPKTAYFFTTSKIYPFLSFGANYLNYMSGSTVADGFRLKFSGGICAPFSGNAVFFIEAGYLYDKLFYSTTSFSQGITYLGLGIGGFITPKKR
jgi:hypothetical protein